MRGITFFAFLAVAFTAIAAAPHASNSVAVLAKGEEKSLIGDIISAIIGVEVDTVITQTKATIKGLVRVGTEAATELEEILKSSGAGLVSEAQFIIRDALKQAEVILEPIIKLINQIVALIPGAGSQKNIIGDIIEALIKNLLNKLNKVIEDLQQLAVDTVQVLIALAAQAGQGTVDQVNALAGRVIADAAAEIQPLLDLLEPVLNPKPIDEIINDLIEAVVGLDIKAIVIQVDKTVTGLDALLNSSANELNEILVSNGINAQQELQAVVNSAVAEAREILKPIIDLINLIVSIVGALGRDSRKSVSPKDLISTIIQQLLQKIENLVGRLEQLLVDTVNQLVAIAANNGANTAGEIEALAQRTLTDARALIKPLLDLLAPILPPSKRITA